MTKKMLIETSSDEARVAIVQDGKLVDYNIEARASATLKGNIYKGLITNVERGLAACFVDFGVPKQGFLPFSDIRADALIGLKGKTEGQKVQDLLRRRGEVVVQVTRDELGSKGAALTCDLSVAGRYSVLMHSEDGRGGVSRKIEDESARKKAKEILSKLKVTEGLGVIIRTAGMDRTKTELQRDLSALLRTWKSVQKAAKIGRAPTLLYREPDIVVRTIRDYLLPDVTEVLVDDPDEYADALDFFQEAMPKQKELLRLYRGNQGLFAAHGVEDQITSTWDRKVRLPSGGEIVIDQTEALVAIDVNSARSTKEKGHEETVFKTNLEAAEVIARQLRLRDMGGIVVIDFIDHAQRKHDREVEKALREAMKPDKAKTTLGRISRFGTLELTRQRIRRAHTAVGTMVCSSCDGRGRVRDLATRGLEVLRNLRQRAGKDPAGIESVIATVDVELANHLLNTRRDDLVSIEQASAVRVQVHADPQVSQSSARYSETRRSRKLSETELTALVAPAPEPPSEPVVRAPRVAAPVDDEPEFDDENENDNDSEEAEASAEPRKKRRRRRRRKPSNGTDTEAASATGGEDTCAGGGGTSSGADAASDDEPEPASSDTVFELDELGGELDDPLEEALFGAGPLAPGFQLQLDSESEGSSPGSETAEETSAPKRKRRRRRRRKPRSEGENGVADADASTDASTDTSADTNADTEAQPGASAEG